MNASQTGIDLIKRFEGLALESYRDVAGVWTIGYGHTAGFKDGRLGPDSVVAEEDAAALLREDLSSREALLSEWMEEHGVDLNRNEFDALISFIFNVGFAAFENSTAAKRLIASERPDREGGQNEGPDREGGQKEGLDREGGQNKNRARLRASAAEALTWWNRATVGGEKVEVLGLTRRRAAEKALFLTPACGIQGNTN